MTLIKASQLLKQDLADPGSLDIVDLGIAQSLAIHALCRITANRKAGIAKIWCPLPGETRDETWKGH